MNTPEVSAAIPAATVVVFRTSANGAAPELLMVVRANSMRFAGGAAVFPGGRVDDADRELAASLTDEHDVDERAHRIAAIRETLEESGLAIGLRGDLEAQRVAAARALLHERQELASVLDEFGFSLDLSALVPFARWLPHGLAHDRIFDTRFYLADLGTGAVDLAVDATENTRLFWTSAADALANEQTGEISLIFPTRRNLERLAQFGSFAEARSHAEATPIVVVSPRIDNRGGVPMLHIPEGAGYPVTSEPVEGLHRG